MQTGTASLRKTLDVEATIFFSAAAGIFHVSTPLFDAIHGIFFSNPGYALTYFVGPSLFVAGIYFTIAYLCWTRMRPRYFIFAIVISAFSFLLYLGLQLQPVSNSPVSLVLDSLSGSALVSLLLLLFSFRAYRMLSSANSQ